MLEVSDSFTVDSSIEDVWAVVSDMSRVVSCFPNIIRIEPLDCGVRVIFRVDLSKSTDKRLLSYLTRVSSKMDVRYEELKPYESLRVKADGNVIGSKVYVDLFVRLRPIGEKVTEVSYVVKADAGMLIKVLGMGLIQSLVEENAKHFIKEFKSSVEKGKEAR